MQPWIKFGYDPIAEYLYAMFVSNHGANAVSTLRARMTTDRLASHGLRDALDEVAGRAASAVGMS
jgi:hypothetical protein